MNLKSGYTTGTCAAIAVRAAAKMIFENRPVYEETAALPKGGSITAAVMEQSIFPRRAVCAVRKYSGDDPDVTNGMLIFADVRLKSGGIDIDGGEGIGRVTKAGLQQSIGEAAINAVPKQMMLQNILEVFDFYGYDGGADIIISAPDGAEIAEKTFNPRLGIVGGISILGTSGIVEPMSEQAIIGTIRAELSIKRAESSHVLLAPGNYGVDFIRNEYGIDLDTAVKCSNYIGDTLDMCAEMRFESALLIGHIGKLSKLGGGIMNTHSKTADCRMEILAANTAMVCDDIQTVRSIAQCLTTDEAIGILTEKGICAAVMKRLTEKAEFYVKSRVKDSLKVGLIIFSNTYGILGKTDNADEMLRHFCSG